MHDENGPATLDELYEWLDRMGALHGAYARQPINAKKRTEFLALEVAYNDAATKLKRVMTLSSAVLGKERTE